MSLIGDSKSADVKNGDIVPGHEVTIYEDPLTEQQPEGRAVLLEKVDEDIVNASVTLETWIVRFNSDGFKCQRRIKVVK